MDKTCPEGVQHFHAHSSPTNSTETTKIITNNKEAFVVLIVLLKSQTTKEDHQQQNKSNTLKNPQYTFIDAIP
jgi:hypothetical protein